MGHPKTAMFRTLIGTGMNIILGWLFILKFDWGVRGAALATVISQCAASVFVMSFFLQKETPIKICRRYMKLKMPFVRRIFILGLPPA
jgi:Na+-driven multidrug efflux pump